MLAEPFLKRAVAFFDGQNLFHAARAAFGYRTPSYDARALAGLIARRHGWRLIGTHFYTGMPDPGESAHWHRFWVAKLAAMQRAGVHTISRPLAYRTKLTTLPDGSVARVRVGQEKGIDVRIALDVVRLARESAYDVALIFSQDQDLCEVATEIRAIARMQERWIKVASAYPASPSSRNTRGIDRTDWLPITREEYECCLEG